jgi:hypothetical protein
MKIGLVESTECLLFLLAVGGRHCLASSRVVKDPIPVSLTVVSAERTRSCLSDFVRSSQFYVLP